MSFSLIASTDKHMTRERLSPPRQPHCNPSASSVIWTDSHDRRMVAGSCLRQSFLRSTGNIKGTTPSVHTMWIWELGKSVENILVEQYKQMGIWFANNLKFYNEEYNLSGEIDAVLKDPDGNLFFAEIKSFYGYYAARQIIGGPRVGPGRPKTSQLLQTLVYLNEFKDTFPYGKMIYYARDSEKRAEFDITLEEEVPGVTRPVINGVTDVRFTIEDIYARFKDLQHHIENNVLPEPDFKIKYSAEEIEAGFQYGDISKTAYEKWQKGKGTVGDWQCRYCDFERICWNRNGERVR
jgi:hypothetical protein